MVGDSDKWMAVTTAEPSVAMRGDCSVVNWVVETDGRSVDTSADLMVERSAGESAVMTVGGLETTTAGETDVTMAATKAGTRVAKMTGEMATMKAEMTADMKVAM